MTLSAWNATLLTACALLLCLAACGGGGHGPGSDGGSGANLSGIVFTEFMPAAGWLEIRNVGTKDRDLDGALLAVIDGLAWDIPDGTLAVGESLKLVPILVLPAAGGVRLLDRQRRIVTQVTWQENPVSGASYGVTSAGTWQCMTTPTPGEENVDPAALVIINEFCPDNDSDYENPDLPGEYEDWIELYNAGDVDVDLGGYTMTDDITEPDQWVIPSGTIIPTGGYLMVHADKEDATLGGTHAAFKLSGSGEEIGLFALGGAVIDAVAYESMGEDRSRGHRTDGSASWATFRGTTPAGANADGLVDATDDPAHRVRDPDYDYIYDATVVRRFDIEIAPDQFSEMRADLAANFPRPFDKRDFSYVECTVRCEGETWEHVGIRYKGNSSVIPYGSGLEKLPLKLDFDEDEDAYPETKNQRFYGVKKLVFNNGFRDPSLVRELLCLELLRDLGAHVSRAAPVRIFVNDVYWGLYISVEQVDSRFLDDRFGSHDGNLYKPEGDGAGLTHFEQDTFVKKSNEDEADWSDIHELIAVLADPSGDIGAIVDVDSFLPWLAVSTAICNLDSYAVMDQNFYLYKDSDSGKFVFIPWDHNEAFGSFTWPLKPGTVHTFDVLAPYVGDRPLIERVLENPTWNQRYLDMVGQLLDGPLAEAPIDAKMNDAHDLMRPYVTGAQGEVHPYTLLLSPLDFDGNLDSTVGAGPFRILGVRELLTRRRDYLESVLK
jgi:spore coat protein H